MKPLRGDSRRLWLSLAATAAVIAAIVLLSIDRQSSQGTPHTARAAAEGGSNQAPHLTEVEARRVPSIAGSSQPAASGPTAEEREALAKLRASFENSENLAAFVHEALLRKDLIGRAYARIALDYCVVAASFNLLEPTRAEREGRASAIHAREHLRRETGRCRDVESMNADFHNKLALLADPALGTPARPLFALGTDRKRVPPEGKSLRALLPDLSWALATEDPNLFRLGFEQLMLYQPPELTASGPKERDLVLPDVWWAVICDLAPSCRKLTLSWICLVLEGACGFERYAEATALRYSDDPAAAKMAVDLVPRIRAAIAAGDLSLLDGSATR